MLDALLDKEDENHAVVPGAWRQDRNMQDLHNVMGGNRAMRAAKLQQLYLKHYINSRAGSVPWQNKMI